MFYNIFLVKSFNEGSTKFFMTKRDVMCNLISTNFELLMRE